MDILGAFGGQTAAGAAIAGTGAGLLTGGLLRGPSYNEYRDPGLDIANNYYGGYEGGAQDMAKQGMLGAGRSTNLQNFANQQSMWGGLRNPRAYENQTLSNWDAQSRGAQGGALSLAGQAAEGKTPSEAAYLMQSGLNRAISNQSALTGSARGANAMALAQGNQGANVAAMQQQTMADTAALRAREMAQARQDYLQGANSLRQADQGRLGMGNQMSQFNANLNDQYSLGMGNLALGASNAGANWYNAAQRPLEQQLQGDQQYQRNLMDLYNAQQGRAYGEDAFNANVAGDWSKGLIGLGGSLLGIGGQVVAGAGGGNVVAPHNSNAGSGTPVPSAASTGTPMLQTAR